MIGLAMLSDIIQRFLGDSKYYRFQRLRNVFLLYANFFLDVNIGVSFLKLPAEPGNRRSYSQIIQQMARDITSVRMVFKNLISLSLLRTAIQRSNRLSTAPLIPRIFIVG